VIPLTPHAALLLYTSAMNPTEGPFGEAAKIPEYGDPEILPKGTVTRPSADRMPFGPSGELLPEGPTLPPDFLLAPDIAGFPWVRKRGDEWTDAVFRSVVFDWLIDYFDTRSWARSWDIRERAASDRGVNKLPDDQHYLRIGVSDGASQRFETSATFPVAERDAISARVILDRAAATLDVQQAAA